LDTAEIDFITKVHTATKRDYVGLVMEADKAECAEVAFKFDKDRSDGERRFGYGEDSLTVGLAAVYRLKFACETRDAVAHLYPTAEEARITCAIVDAAARVRDLNFKYMAEGKGATVTARFGPDGITICDPNRASEGTDKVFQRIYDRAT